MPAGNPYLPGSSACELLNRATHRTPVARGPVDAQETPPAHPLSRHAFALQRRRPKDSTLRAVFLFARGLAIHALGLALGAQRGSALRALEVALRGLIGLRSAVFGGLLAFANRNHCQTRHLTLWALRYITRHAVLLGPHVIRC